MEAYCERARMEGQYMTKGRVLEPLSTPFTFIQRVVMKTPLPLPFKGGRVVHNPVTPLTFAQREEEGVDHLCPLTFGIWKRPSLHASVYPSLNLQRGTIIQK